MYRDLKTLLAKEITTDESEATRCLMLLLGQARKRGYLTKREFLAACRWKSPRAIHLYAQNSPSKIKKQSAIAFATKSERGKLKALMTLEGVGVPMASAILTLTNPRRYGVIDIRVWQLLFDLGSVQTKPRGVGFNFKNWYEFLVTLRSYARELGVTVRCVEHSLFRYHQKVQTGVLYKRETTKDALRTELVHAINLKGTKMR